MSAARGMTASVRAVTRKIPIPTRAPIILVTTFIHVFVLNLKQTEHLSRMLLKVQGVRLRVPLD